MRRDLSPGQCASTKPSTLVAESAELQVPPLARSWSCEVLRGGVELIEQLALEWRRLCQDGSYSKPFFRPEWFRAYVRAFAPDKQIWLVTLRDRGRLSAVLPLAYEQVAIFGLPVARLCGLANDHSPRFDLILGAGVSAEEAAAEIWKALRNFSGWDFLKAPNVPAGGAFEEILHAAEQEGYPTGRWESFCTPSIALPEGGNPETAQLGGTDSKFRANLRRRKRKLTAQGNVLLRRVEKADPAELESFYRLEQAGWKGRQGSAIACKPSTRQFYDEVAREAGRFGYLSLYFLELDGRAVAGHFGLAHEGIYYCPKVGYDEQWHAYSPGHLLVEAILRDCTARGLREFDFVGPKMEWKSDWTSQVRHYSWCFVFSRSWKARMLHAAKFRIVPIVKEKLSRRRPAVDRVVRTRLRNWDWLTRPFAALWLALNSSGVWSK